MHSFPVRLVFFVYVEFAMEGESRCIQGSFDFTFVSPCML